MKQNKLADTMDAFWSWLGGTGTLYAVSDLLGDMEYKLPLVFVTSGLCDFRYNRIDGRSDADLVNCFLLFVAIHKNIFK